LVFSPTRASGPLSRLFGRPDGHASLPPTGEKPDERAARPIWRSSPTPGSSSTGAGGTSCPVCHLGRTTLTTQGVAPRLRVAEPVLVLPAQALPGATIADHPGAARSERRAVSLGEPPASRRRAQAPLHLPRRLRARGLAAVGAGAARQCRPAAPGAGGGAQGDPGARRRGIDRAPRCLKLRRTARSDQPAGAGALVREPRSDRLAPVVSEVATASFMHDDDRASAATVSNGCPFAQERDEKTAQDAQLTDHNPRDDDPGGGPRRLSALHDIRTDLCLRDRWKRAGGRGVSGPPAALSLAPHRHVTPRAQYCTTSRN